MSERTSNTEYRGIAPACCDSVLLQTCCAAETKQGCCGSEAAPKACGCNPERSVAVS